MMFSDIIAIISLAVAIFMYLSTESWKRRLKIELSRIIADSHAFYGLIMQSNTSDSLKERYSSLNHGITVALAGVDKKFARAWIKNSKPESEWQVWEQHLQVSMDKYRSKKSKEKS